MGLRYNTHTYAHTHIKWYFTLIVRRGLSLILPTITVPGATPRLVKGLLGFIDAHRRGVPTAKRTYRQKFYGRTSTYLHFSTDQVATDCYPPSQIKPACALCSR